MRSPFSKRKSHLSEQAKAIAAAQVLLDVQAGLLEPDTAGVRLRADIGLQWTFLSCIQFLSGKTAIGALSALPEDWRGGGHTKSDRVKAVLVAADIVANVRPDGQPLCASDLAKRLTALSKPTP